MGEQPKVVGPPQRVIVRGASWRRDGDRRQRAARIARVLRPMAHMLGAVVSTELAVPLRGGWYRPDVGVLSDGDGLRDGVLPGPPPLVVCLGGPIPARAWLHAGADVVWALIDDTAWQLTYRRLRVVGADEWLRHPWEPSLRMLARELTGGTARRTRMTA